MSGTRNRKTVWDEVEELTDPTPEGSWARDRLRGDLIAFASNRDVPVRLGQAQHTLDLVPRASA